MSSLANTGGDGVVPILRGRAGEIEVALASDAVYRVGLDRTDLPHVCAVLGMSDAAESGRGPCKVIALTHNGESIELRIDEPVHFAQVAREHVVGGLEGIDALANPMFLGYARLAECLVLLLDASKVAAAASRLTKAVAT